MSGGIAPVSPQAALEETQRRELQGSASSVLLAFTIALPSFESAQNAVNQLGVHLTDTTASSAFLTTSSYTAIVTAIIAVPNAAYPPSSLSQALAYPPPPPSLGLVIGVAAGIGVAVLVLAFFAGRYCMYCVT